MAKEFNPRATINAYVSCRRRQPVERGHLGLGARQISRKSKKTRDATFVATSKIKIKEKIGGVDVEKEIQAVVNRTMGMASVGSAALDNEECYLYKFLRGLGLVYIEHQARI